MSETEIVKQLMVHASELGARLFRNNSGKFKDVTGRWITFGVGNPGGADLIGWRPILIEPKHIGMTMAQFLAVEVKTPTGKATPQQIAFLEMVNRYGGRAGISRSAEELTTLLRR